ncbi:aspartate/glutamate racemase family protein [bacterium]|nr:aspartate/glutamate racemase family protein [bacterium]
MKTLGLIGGTSWASTLEYYRIINELVHEKLGGVSGARMILWSVNLAEFVEMVQTKGKDSVAGHHSEIAKKLEACGAEGLVICANTPHIAADEIQKSIRIPIIHIADATAKEILARGLKKVALLGTTLTMEEPFYRDRLARYDIETMIPEPDERAWVHGTIFEELSRNIFTKETKQKYLDLVGKLSDRGAQGIILGCTEIPLLLNQADTSVPLFDTTLLHARAAAEFALS